MTTVQTPPAGPPAGPGYHLPSAYPGMRLASERVVVSAPMSFTGSQQRLWPAIVDSGMHKALAYPLAVAAVGTAWVLVLSWYMVCGLLLVPYRLIRRGSRKQKLYALRHVELVTAMSQAQPPQPLQPRTHPLGVVGPPPWQGPGHE